MNSINEIRNDEKLRLSNQESNKLTKESLSEALITLMSEMPFEDITITQLVKKAGVSRQAFYRNYSSKEDIINQMNDELIRTIHSALSSDKYKNNPYLLFLHSFEIAKKNAKICLLSLKANVFQKFFFDNFSIINSITSSATRYQYIAIVGAFTNIFINWLVNGMQESVESMAELCMKILKTEPLTT